MGSPTPSRSMRSSAVLWWTTIAVRSLNERLGFLAHELRNHIQTATLAVTAIKAGNVGLGGATGAVLDRSLIGMQSLVDRSLADVRVAAGMPPRHRLTSLADFVADVKISASLEAKARQCNFTCRRCRPGSCNRCRPGNALFSGWKPAAKRIQIYSTSHGSLIECVRCRGSHPHRH